jgi:predicted AlkP superfamily phosphohydrolase/phosphomutase
MVIGLDGATWDLLRPRMDDGRLPNLKRLADAGAAGNLTSVYTPETPTAWSTFMTGFNPGKHGVFDFMVYDPVSQHERPVNSRMRVGKNIWDYLGDVGKTSLVLNLPTTYPPSPIKGAMICGFLSPREKRDFAYPKELIDELEEEFGRYPLFFETMMFLASGTEKHAELLLSECYRMESTKFDVAEKLFDRYQPDFTMLHIWGTDRLQHEMWNLLDPEHPLHDKALAQKFVPRIEEYYSMIDKRVGQLVDKLGPEGITFIISDHGFGPTYYLIDQNSWLLREGFIVLKKSLKVKFKKLLWDLGVTPHNVMKVLRPLLKLSVHFKAPTPDKALNRVTGTITVPGMLSLNDVDWSKTKAYAPYGWSGIFVNTQGIRPNGSVLPEEYDAVCAQIVARWNQLKNPHTGELVGGPVPINKEMFHGPFAKYGPDVLPLPLGQKYMPVCFFGFASKEPVYANYMLPGNHRMEGIIIAEGDGIKKGPVEGARLLDMAPTILHLLNHPVPDNMDGRSLTDLMNDEELARNPLRTMHVEEGESTQGEGLSDEEQDEIRSKLMGLGYL